MKESNQLPRFVQISLTHNNIALIDQTDSDLAKYKWHSHDGYARRWIGKKPNRKQISLHRVILQRMIKRPLDRDEYCDHINNDISDNRRENLRLCSKTQNNRNVKRRKDNTSGYKGVSVSPSGQIQAKISVNGKQRYIGSFRTVEEAYDAYCQAARELHKEFSNLG